MFKFIYTLVLILTAQVILSAQQLPLFTFFREYHSVINPGAIHHDYFLNNYTSVIGISYRDQWRGLPGNPRTALLHGTHLFENSGASLFVGGHLMNDQTGPIHQLGLYGKVGVIISDDPYYGGLSLGLLVGYNQIRLKTKELRAADVAEILSAGPLTKYSPDVGVGMFWQSRLSNDDNVYLGLSAPQLFAINPNFSEQDRATYERVSHFYFTMGYAKYLSDVSYLEPSVWVKYVFGNVHVDGSLRAQLSESFWLGAGYSTSDLLHLEAGFIFGENIGLYNTVRVGYSLDEGFNQFSFLFGRTHEFFINYAFGG